MANNRGPRRDQERERVESRTTCGYNSYDLRSYIHEAMHVILDDSAQIRATVTLCEPDRG